MRERTCHFVERECKVECIQRLLPIRLFDFSRSGSWDCENLQEENKRLEIQSSDGADFKNLGSRLLIPKKWICMCEESDKWHNCRFGYLVGLISKANNVRLKFDWNSHAAKERWENDLPWKELLRIPLRTCSTDWYRSSSLQLWTRMVC